MAKYILKRILYMALILLIVTTITFFLLHAIPGDPITAMVQDLPEETRQIYLRTYGFDRPVIEQYFLYIKQLLTGNLGQSLRYPGRKVADIVANYSPVSALVGGISLIIGVVLGLLCGILAALKSDRWPDRVIMILALLGTTIPTFVIASVLQYALSVTWPMISGYSITESVNTAIRNNPPDSEHWFGTDAMGRDLFNRVCVGGRVSIAIGFFGAVIVMILGSLYGGFAALLGGKADMAMMRIVDILSSIPNLLVIILISVIVDSKGIGTILFAMTVTGWCPTARIVRSQMLQISQSDYVLAARLMDISSLKIVLRHLIPNTMSVIIVDATFRVPGFIFSEAFLSYVGLGIQPPGTSWGALAAGAQGMFQFYPWQLLFPAGMIALTMLVFTLLGDGLRDALDPRLRR